MNTKVLSLGGSIVAPEKPDTQFLNEFVRMAREWISSSEENRLVLVVGGGAPARIYQNAYKET
ncbi:MAG: UMP kinase, partial [Treponemataceae bacterium]|nr:UMP kinase [Treponemataceae bacterium]